MRSFSSLSYPYLFFVDPNCPRKEVRCVLRLLRRDMICLIQNIRDLASVNAIMIYTRSLRYGPGEAVSLTRIMNIRDVLDHIINTISLLALLRLFHIRGKLLGYTQLSNSI